LDCKQRVGIIERAGCKRHGFANGSKSVAPAAHARNSKRSRAGKSANPGRAGKRLTEEIPQIRLLLKEASMGAIDVKDVIVKMNSLLDAVSRGESFEIAREGVPVAQVVPLSKTGPKARNKKRMPDLTAFRASLPVSGKSLTDALLDMREQNRY